MAGARSEGLSRIQSKTLGLKFIFNPSIYFWPETARIHTGGEQAKCVKPFQINIKVLASRMNEPRCFSEQKLLRVFSSPPSNCCCGLRLLQQTKIWLNGQTHGLERGRMNMKCEISVGLKKKKRKKKAVASFIMFDVGNLSKVPKTVTKQNLLTKAGR